MIWILLSILYVALGYLYSETAWSSPEIKKELEELLSMVPPGTMDRHLAAAKILIALFWPVFLFGSIGVYILQVLGIISPPNEEEDE